MTKNTHKELMSTIKSLRTEKGFSQEQTASAIGVSRPTYTAIETGKQKLDIEEAKKLAVFLGIDVEDIVYEDVSNLEKYKHMILAYLRAKVSDDGKVTKTKLAKLLYLADFAWYYDHMKSMSGMRYRRLQYGPVPDMFFRALAELEDSGKIVVERKDMEEREMFLISESESNKNDPLEKVSTDEASLIKRIAEKWKDKKTQDIVNFTHNQLPYRICRDNEIIPYELITQEDSDLVY